MQVAGEVNKKEGEAFLAANKGKEGVVTLPSGLQYKILTPGTGPKPTAADTVVCNYRGTLINGTEFDSSYKRGQPATFPVSGSDQGMDRGAAAHARGIEVAAFHSRGSGLRRPRTRTRDRSQLHLDLRSRIAFNPKQERGQSQAVALPFLERVREAGAR